MLFAYLWIAVIDTDAEHNKVSAKTLVVHHA